MRITLLGSSGSIGVQTLDIVRENPEMFEVVALVANRSWERLAQQAIEFDVDTVVIGDETLYPLLKERLKGYDIKVYAGEGAVADVASYTSVDLVVNALVGYAGLIPTVRTLEAGVRLALANKESLVVGGEYVMKLARQRGIPILPIDSEHSAIFQCLMGETSPLRRVILTCSGGSLRDLSREELRNVTVEQALRHPQWSMGAKITIDSSTLINKGLEVIEAHHLFGLEADRISVIQHPQAVVHSMVEFCDGSIKAQLGTPDMRLPISLAMMFPHRASRPTENFSFFENPTLSFEEVDREKYPALDISYEALRRGGSACCTLNAANEVAVAAFLDKRCGYLDIVESIRYALHRSTFESNPSLETLAEVDREARGLASEYLKL